MRKINELELNRTDIFDETRLDGYTARQLDCIIKKFTERALHGDFWAFQVAIAAAQKKISEKV